MALVNGYEYDVFVSYAHIDNEPDPFGDAWVDRLVRDLKTAIEQRSGRVGQLELYFDNRRLQGSQPLEQLLESVRRSAVFLAVCSPSYANREWTLSELRAFVGAPPRTDGLIAIERLPIDKHDRYPDPLHSHHRLAFFLRDQPESDIPLTITPRVNGALYYARINKLAEVIQGQLLRIGAKAPDTVSLAGGPPISDAAPPASVASANPPPVSARVERQGIAACTVLVGQVTEDLEVQREELISYLSQFGVPVLPTETYPQAGPEFREAVADDLKLAGLFAQLLGPTPSRRPRDLPEGYLAAQSTLALDAGVSTLKWRPPAIRVEQVADTDQRAQLAGETVMIASFESFKAEVLRRATLPPPQPPEPPGGGLIFVNADTLDRPIAESVFQTLSKGKLAVVQSQSGGSASKVRADFERIWRECGAVILVYGQADPLWLRGQMMAYERVKRTRQSAPKPFAILYAPPEEKRPVDMTLPEIEVVDCRHGLTDEAVLGLFA